MSVTLRGHTFYTDAEVSAMTPSGTIDSQWETYTLPITGGCSSNWQLNRFHVNKITGLVTGEIGLISMQNLTTSKIGTKAELGIHSGMRIKYTGNWEYGTTKSTATAAYMMHWKELNGLWDTSGNFYLEGWPWATAYIPYMDSFLETHAYIGSRYGKITTTDVKDPIYLDEGAFYDANTVDLITGHAWLRIDVTLPTGYKSGSFLTFYKNLWSGEIIVQYYLLPTTATTGYLPYITIPSRVIPVDNRILISGVRYQEGATTANQRQHMYFYFTGDTIRFYGGGSGGNITRMDGSLYYPGVPEVRSQNASYETQALYVPESSSPISSAQNSKFPSANPTTAFQETGGTNSWLNTSYFKGRDAYPNWVWRSKRTGMVFAYFDLTTVQADFPANGQIFSTGQRWGTDWIPSYRYNEKSGTAQPIYFSGAGYLGTRAAATGDAVSSEYSCNIDMLAGKSLGVQDTTNTDYGLLTFGTSGNLKAATGNLACFTGYYLGNSAANIVK